MSEQQQLGRNEPCHCGVDAAPKLSAPAQQANPLATTDGATGAPGGFGGFDPSKMDPAMMLQFSQALQRLPRGQLQRLQGIMQRAMSGQDVTREAAEFEKTLPTDIQQLMMSFAGQMAQQGMGGGEGFPALPGAATGSEGGMTEEEARQIVAAAAAEGKVSQDEADKLLAPAEKKGLGKLWGKK
jgi:hypothetical protein